MAKSSIPIHKKKVDKNIVLKMGQTMAKNNILNNDLSNCSGLPISGIQTATSNTVVVTDGSGIMTGVGSMTNGQIVIGSSGSTPVRANLTAGSGISISNGAGSITIASSGSPVTLKNVRFLTASGTYTKTAGTVSCFVVAIGGGGGGSARNSASAYNFGSGGGGGGCGYKYYATAPDGASYTIGAGGAGGVSNASGSAGGTTSFSTNLVVGGGAPGLMVGNESFGAGASAAIGPYAAGGTPGGGDASDFFSVGGASVPWFWSPSTTGNAAGAGGGNGFGSGNGTVPAANVAGLVGASPGCGGSGVYTGASSPRTAGAGAAGLIIVYEYGV